MLKLSIEISPVTVMVVVGPSIVLRFMLRLPATVTVNAEVPLIVLRVPIAISPATATLEVPLIVLVVISKSPTVTLITAALPVIVLLFIARLPAVTFVAV